MADTRSARAEDRVTAAELYPLPDTDEIESWAIEEAMPSEPDDYDEELDYDDDDAADDRVVYDDADVDNAGLVLCAVFLPRLCDYLKLWKTDRRQWVSPAAPHRAAGLLQYVATGDEQPPEHQVTLNKVLCGLAPDAVFDFGGPATDDELDACDELSVAVVLNAEEALGELDVDDFRTRYFPRRGVLSAGRDSWLLRVERRDGDERLDQLPWPFRVLMLPWMRYPLQVEW